jgi:hypothetical protein
MCSVFVVKKVIIMSDQLHNPSVVAKILSCPVNAVRDNLELIYAALNNSGILTSDVAIGVLGTIAIETASTFRPVEEAFWLPLKKRNAYFDKTAYGQVDLVTGQRYFGRGFVQRTWKSGYETSGKILQLPLLNHPEMLLQPAHAAADLALFWISKSALVPSCLRHDWYAVRRLVSGGFPEITRLQQICEALLKISH